MVPIKDIKEKQKAIEYLHARHLFTQYQKAKEYLLSGHLSKVRFKERNPKGCNIYYFRINKQFRAFGAFRQDGVLVIFEIDNHQ